MKQKQISQHTLDIFVAVFEYKEEMKESVYRFKYGNQKADVTILTDNEVLKKRIVGKNNNNLITMDNEYIPVDKIRDIYKS